MKVLSTHGCPGHCRAAGGLAGSQYHITWVPITSLWEGGGSKQNPLQAQHKRVFACLRADLNADIR